MIAKPIKPLIQRMAHAAVFMIEIIQDSAGLWSKGRSIQDHPKEWLRSNWHSLDFMQKLTICQFAGISYFQGDRVSDSWAHTEYDSQLKLAEGLKKAVDSFFKLQGEVSEMNEAGFFEYLKGVDLIRKTGLEIMEVI